MKTLYLDCGMGAAGDMLAAALLELLPDPEGFLAELNALGIPGVTFEKQTVSKCGINGTYLSVKVNGESEESHDVHDHDHTHEHSPEHVHEHACEHEHVHSHEHEEHAHTHDHDHDGHSHEHSHEDGHHHHHHSSLHDIEHIVRGHMSLSKKVADDVMAVYQLIAEAESKAHGVPVTEIHFHEVGTMDAIADISAVCMLMDRIAPDKVIASPVHVGSGQVHCAHGILPVPAPATAYILRDVPIYGGSIKGELCTPTGAALLKHFVSEFSYMPVMKISSIGYGCGKKDFEAANCVRALLGETEDKKESILSIACNIDDMTAEELGFAAERLFDAGALDVYTVPIGMKKSRPGTELCVLCRIEDREIITQSIFKHTTTLGIRMCEMQRQVQQREFKDIGTPYGIVREKVSNGHGKSTEKYEYEDLARIAREQDISLFEVRDLLKK